MDVRSKIRSEITEFCRDYIRYGSLFVAKIYVSVSTVNDIHHIILSL